jgi:hypothetical protein
MTMINTPVIFFARKGSSAGGAATSSSSAAWLLDHLACPPLFFVFRAPRRQREKGRGELGRAIIIIIII